MPAGLAAATAAAVAIGAALAGALTVRGALAAWSVGTLILAGTGWPGGAVLAAFFLSSTIVSRLTRTPRFLDPKGNRRDAAQVYANGGVAAVAALAAILRLLRPEIALLFVTSSLAAAAADTWATSIGSRSSRPPRLIPSGRAVPPGTSGGVTWLGTAGGVAGAAVVGLAAALTAHSGYLAVSIIVGVAGMLADSALGATLQGRFHCPACGLASEWPRHRCGNLTIHEGGWSWLTNDRVNAAATAFAAALGWLVWRGLVYSAA